MLFDRFALKANKLRQRKEQQFEGIEESGYAVGPRTGWRLCKPAQGKPVAFVAIVLVPLLENATIGRQEVGIPGILHGLTILEHFSQSPGPVSGWAGR